MHANYLKTVSAILLLWSVDIDSSRQLANSEVSDAILFLRARELEDWSRAVFGESEGDVAFSPTRLQLQVFSKFCLQRIAPFSLHCMPFLDVSEQFSPRNPCEEMLCLNTWLSWNKVRLDEAEQKSGEEE